MEAMSLLISPSFPSSSSSSQFHVHIQQSNSSLPSSNSPSHCFSFSNNSRFVLKNPIHHLRSTHLLFRTCALVIDDELVEKPISEGADSRRASSSRKGRDFHPKIDKSGKFSSPRAARELALTILYAACIEGSDPVRLFEKRLNARREPGFEFDKAYLSEYNLMNFGGPPVTVETNEEADGLRQHDDRETLIEAEVLAAPPKMVYSKLILGFTRKLLVAVVEKWDSHVVIIDKIAPANWKLEAAGKILELCILRLAMSEIALIGTRHQIVINEAVDLAKRFCDGAAPRVINGCLRTFVKDTIVGNEDRSQ